MKEIKKCPHCDAKMVEYRHTFNKGLAHGMYELLLSGGGPTSLRSLRLTRTEWTNFQKLRYWDLVSRTKHEGEWILTSKGVDFMTKGASLPKWVWTYRGEAVRFDGDACFFKDIHEPRFDTREDYIKNSQPRTK